jgi:hypothetical protein
MTAVKTTRNTKTKDGRGWFLFARGTFLAAAFFVVALTASAGEHRKVAADFANFPQHRDGTVDVIIQFKQTPQAHHFAEMAAHGGRIKFPLFHIRGAAYRIPVRMLTWLENHPDVAYVPQQSCV